MAMFFVKATNLGEFHHKAREHEASERLGVARLQVALEQQTVALLFGTDIVTVGEVITVRREQREDE